MIMLAGTMNEAKCFANLIIETLANGRLCPWLLINEHMSLLVFYIPFLTSSTVLWTTEKW